MPDLVGLSTLKLSLSGRVLLRSKIVRVGVSGGIVWGCDGMGMLFV